MSLEGLLSEARRFNANGLQLALGEQLFYGGRRVFSDVRPGPSKGGDRDHHHHHHDHKKGGRNELQDAITNAKNIASHALKAGPPANDGAVTALRNEHNELATKVEQLSALVRDLQLELASLRQGKGAAPAAQQASAPAPAAAAADDDDFDLFGSEDEEDEEKKKVVEERLKAYNEKKSKKPGPIAKSSVILDVKPWDDETDLAEMEKLVRSIELDGLVWGGAKLIPIGYGIKKLQIISVIEDLKVSVDDLIEKITGDFEDHVQSVDIVAFNKI